MVKIKTKRLRIVNADTLVVAVDISKITPTGYCRCPDGKDCKPFEFSNNVDGFKKLWDRICWMKAFHRLEEVVVGFESTGPYGEPLVHYLRKKPVKLVQVNPLHTRRIKDLEGNSPGKTDRKDSKVIADIIQLGHALSVVIPEGAAAQLRRLIQARARKVEQWGVLHNQLYDLVFLIFPEFLQVMKDLRTRTAHYLLRHYPTAEAIVGLGVEALSLMLRRVSRGRLSPERAEALYKAAQDSVGLQEGREAMLLEVEQILSQMEGLQRFIRQLEQEMVPFLRQIPYIDSILSLKGIGEVTAAGLIGEVGDFTKFGTISEVEKLAGLDLFEISSGRRKGSRRISKRGRPLLRKLLYFAAMNTVRKGGVMRGFYQRHLERGMPKIKALVAIARKLLRILFALVRDHSFYKENYLQSGSLNLAA